MRRPWRILLADDDDDSRELCAEYLHGLGFEVVQARNGAEALERASRRRVDLFVLDLQMPVLGGLEAVARLRADAKSQAVPIIVVSGNGESDRQKAVRAGCNVYIMKPCDLHNLADVARALLEANEEANEPESPSRHGTAG